MIGEPGDALDRVRIIHELQVAFKYFDRADGEMAGSMRVMDHIGNAKRVLRGLLNRLVEDESMDTRIKELKALIRDDDDPPPDLDSPEFAEWCERRFPPVPEPERVRERDPDLRVDFKRQIIFVGRSLGRLDFYEQVCEAARRAGRESPLTDMLEPKEGWLVQKRFQEIR